MPLQDILYLADNYSILCWKRYPNQMWQANQTIKDDRFLIQAVLGGGGFGIAYRAVDLQLKRLVVIKTLNQRQQN